MTPPQRPPNGPFFDVLALGILLTLAAALQHAVSPWMWGFAKPPFLLAVATYYAMFRPMLLAIAATLLAGAWTDGLGSAPGCPVLLAALAQLAYAYFHGRTVLKKSFLNCALIATVATLLATLLQALFLFQAGRFSDSATVFFFRLLCQTLLAAPVAIATAGVAFAFERVTGNTPPEPKGGAPAHVRP